MSVRMIAFHVDYDLFIELRRTLNRLDSETSGERHAMRALCEGLLKDGLETRSHEDIKKIVTGVAVKRGRKAMVPDPEVAAPAPKKPMSAMEALGWGPHMLLSNKKKSRR